MIIFTIVALAAIGRAVYQGGDLIFADLQRRLLDRPGKAILPCRELSTLA